MLIRRWLEFGEEERREEKNHKIEIRLYFYISIQIKNISQ